MKKTFLSLLLFLCFAVNACPDHGSPPLEKKETVKAYFKELETQNLDVLLSLFSPQATVYSPLYGTQGAATFYQELFEDVTHPAVTIKSIFQSVDNPHTAAVHFVYTYTGRDGSFHRSECADVFEFDKHTSKIQSVTIIYDTYTTRKDLSHFKS